MVPIGINWKEIWKPVWDPVWAQEIIIPPPPTAGGAGWGGRVRLPEYEIRLRHNIFGDNFTPEEQQAILAAIAWILK
jgi:hypothetical protein